MVGASGIDVKAAELRAPFAPIGLKELLTIACDALGVFGVALASNEVDGMPFDFFCAFWALSLEVYFGFRFGFGSIRSKSEPFDLERAMAAWMSSSSLSASEDCSSPSSSPSS